MTNVKRLGELALKVSVSLALSVAIEVNVYILVQSTYLQSSIRITP